VPIKYKMEVSSLYLRMAREGSRVSTRWVIKILNFSSGVVREGFRVTTRCVIVKRQRYDHGNRRVRGGEASADLNGNRRV